MNLLNKLIEVLKQEEKFVVNNKLLKNKIIESALKLDPVLIKLLLSEKEFKDYFFVEIEGITIFDKDKFMKFVSNKQFLPDSYTAFKNKIGLAVGEDKYFYENKKVVVNFPYKDCILVGGQDKEDTKRNEVFYNYTLAPEQVDILTEPKVFTNIKKYTKNGIEEIEKIEDSDNLIIKGNNLFALYSLKKRFAGRIKLIYIDPPYNTGNDSFKYNDSFNHSTWLTFMKNRLEIAKELLSKDGAIFVQIDNSPTNERESPELGYLLVLMDEIFGRKNYIGMLIWKKKGNPSNTETNIGTITESILMYAKDFNLLSVNLQEYKRKYKYEDSRGFYNIEQPIKTNEGTYERKTMQFAIKTDEGTFYPPTGKRWTIGEETAKKYVEEKKYKIINNEFYIKKYSEDYKRGEYKLYNNLLDNHGSLKSAKGELSKLGFSREVFDSPKPEILMERIISMVTNQGDIVLDYHLGSGTTATVAHKMKRQYIGIEQMDYIKDITIERLKKVIEGEQGGISKSVNWQGGGSFVYMELFELNKKFDRAIIECKSKEVALKIFEEMLENAILDYSFDLSKAEEIKKYIKENELQDIKKLLLSLLDPNHLYLNFSEIEDETYQISQKDKIFNKGFYNGKI